MAVLEEQGHSVHEDPQVPSGFKDPEDQQVLSDYPAQQEFKDPLV